MREGGLFAAVVWLMAAHALAQPVPPDAGPPRDAGVQADDALPPVPPPPGAPSGEATTPPAQADPYAAPEREAPPTAAEQLTPPPPPPGYGGAPPPPVGSYGATTPSYGATPAWDPEVPAARPAPVDPDRRAGGEMIELYIAGAGWGVLTGTWLVFLAGDPEDAGGGALPILFGGGGALLVYGVDAGVGGLPKGVPASIAMGALTGLLEGLFMLPAFDVPDEQTATTLVWGGATLGAATGALLGTQLRPTTGDARLVASCGLWGAYFAGLTTIVAEVDDEEAAFRTVLGGLNAGLLLGFLLAPASDLHGGHVMLMHAGVGVGSLAGLLLMSMISADSGDFDPSTTALTVGVGAAAGLLGAYLLFGPSDTDEGSEADRASWSPYVAPIRDGAMFGVSTPM